MNGAKLAGSAIRVFSIGVSGGLAQEAEGVHACMLEERVRLGCALGISPPVGLRHRWAGRPRPGVDSSRVS